MFLVLISLPVVALAIAGSIFFGLFDFSLVRHWQDWMAERKADRLVREARREAARDGQS